jgi:hypothetical protein
MTLAPQPFAEVAVAPRAVFPTYMTLPCKDWTQAPDSLQALSRSCCSDRGKRIGTRIIIVMTYFCRPAVRTRATALRYWQTN